MPNQDIDQDNRSSMSSNQSDQNRSAQPSRSGRFEKGSERAREAGRKGGQKSRRTS